MAELNPKCGQCGREVTQARTKAEGLTVDIKLASGEMQHHIGVLPEQEGATFRLEKRPCLQDGCATSVWFDQGAAGFR